MTPEKQSENGPQSLSGTRSNAHCDEGMGQLWSGSLRTLGTVWEPSSSLYCSFSARSEPVSWSAAETMTSLRHAVRAVELLLPTRLTRSQHCNAVVRVPEATVLHRTLKRSVRAVTESTALACSLHNSKSSKSSAPEIPQRQKLVPLLAHQHVLYFGRSWR